MPTSVITKCEEFPFEINSIEDAIQKKINNSFTNQPQKLVQVGNEKFMLPEKFKDFTNVIYNFEARSDDVFISTFPRSGTTWTQEMIWLICNDLDYDTAMKETLSSRFPFMELHLLTIEKELENLQSFSKSHSDSFGFYYEPLYDALAKQTTRRFIKTHLPIQLLPRNIREVGAKVVYVARNPKDVAVSYFHHQRNPFTGFQGNFDNYVKFFMNGHVMYGPYWNHVLDAWSHRNDKNVHFMFYEDLQFDMKSSLINLSEFLENPLEEQNLPRLMSHLHFDNFSKNNSVNLESFAGASNEKFIRRGQVGGNPEMTEDLSMRFDKWMTEDNLKSSDFQFNFKLIK